MGGVQAFPMYEFISWWRRRGTGTTDQLQGVLQQKQPGGRQREAGEPCVAVGSGKEQGADARGTSHRVIGLLAVGWPLARCFL